MSTFSGLTIANSGLAAQRRAIEVTGHNVANANTPGYSRQRVDMGSVSGGSSMIHTGPAVYGGGVSVLSQTRIVDAFLIGRANTEWAAKGTTDTIKQTYSRLEASFNEPGENGLATQLQSYWDAWDAVSSTPEDLAARSALLQRGMAIADTFQGLSQTFDLMTRDVLQRAEAVVSDINAIAAQIASLNEAISSAMNAGAPPNDLLDTRDQLARSLNSQIGVTTRINDNGRMDVSIGGAALVSGTRVTTVSLDTSIPGAAVLRSQSTNIALSPTGGQMEGLLRSANEIIPAQQTALDAVAQRMMEMVNTQHAAGLDLQDPPQNGLAFFVMDAGTPGARFFAVNPDLVGNPQLVAAAAAGEGAFGGGNALQMAELSRFQPTGGQTAGPDALYRSMMADLGVNAQTANRRADLQTQLTQQVDRQREEVSGVSIDEEMANLVAYQQAYQASARFLTAIDEMLSVLMNVGR